MCYGNHIHDRVILLVGAGRNHLRVRMAVINDAVSPPEMRCNARLANDSCCLCCPPLVRENAVGAAGTVEE